MAKSRQEKEQEVASLVDKLRRMKVAVLTTNAGLSVKDSTELRSTLRKSGIDHTVAKKTLLRKALNESSFGGIDIMPITASFGISFGYDDEVAPAKLLAQFAKTHGALQFIGGVLDGVYIDGAQMKQLASLPTRDGLRAWVVGTIAAPLSGLVNVLAGNIRGLAQVLSARRSALENAPAS